MVAPPPPESREATRYGVQEQPRRRALLLAVLLHLLIGLIFAVQKREPIVKMAEQGLTTFNVAPEGPKGAETEKSEQKTEKKTQTKQAASQEKPVVAETPPPPAPPPPVVRDFQMPFIQLSNQDYASSNIGKQASLRPPAAGPAVALAGGSGPNGAGSGPGGATLYPADWYREPTDAELGGYLKPGMPREGSGTIACRTVAQHHVEDCYILGESPRGSGFARSVLNAAWQFLVMPPRVNGKEQVGAWVSIRITYYDGAVKAGSNN